MESGLSNNHPESYNCDTTLTSEGVMEGLWCVGTAFKEEDLPELGVLDCIMIELVVIC